MSRQRTTKIKIEISSTSINKRVETKSAPIKVEHNITFITPNEITCTCYFYWTNNKGEVIR